MYTVPVILSWLEKINTISYRWYLAIVLAVSFPFQSKKMNEKSFAFTLPRDEHILTAFIQNHAPSPALCQNIVCRELNSLNIPQDMTLIPVLYLPA
jgi:hypothetical protein